MSSVPTKQLTELYERIMNNPNVGIRSKNYDAMNTGDEVILWHYNTVILRINMKDKSWIPGGGYSVSDRDAINSFLRLAEIDGYAFIREYHLHYWIDGTVKDRADEFEFKSDLRIIGNNVVRMVE